MEWFEDSSDQQILYLESLVRKNQDSVWNYYLISLYFENEMIEKAKNMCEYILKKNPNDLIAGIILAKIYFSLLQPEESKKILLKLYRSHMDNIVLLKMLGDIEMELRRYSESLRLYEEALKIEPFDKNIIESLEKAREMIAMNQPDEFEKREDRNVKFLGLDQSELAEIKQVFQEIHKKTEQDDLITEKLALKYEESRKWKEAEMVYQSLCLRFPENKKYFEKLEEIKAKGG